MSEMNVRFVVPVYQRPYSWDEEQCARLLSDIYACGLRKSTTHFTGSIVTVQDGSLSRQGVAPLLLIDGQQRITTITLLLIALARYAKTHPWERLAFSHEEIATGGYLTNHFRTGVDHYKLTLSEGDQACMQSLIDELTGTGEIAGGSPRLLENLAFYERELLKLEDVNVVWSGLQRLEVVSIALAQGQDQPQVIFESMNSTGKDLSSSDLVRNFVLMGYPMDEQDDVYRVYWAPIEQILGTRAYSAVFDDFIRSYLLVAQPLTHLSENDAYQDFKRYVIVKSYNEGDRMRILALRLKRFAGYYAAVTTGAVDDAEIAAAIELIARLNVPQINPLLLSLFDRCERKWFSRDQFLGALQLLESYLFRRVACSCENESLAPLVASIIARLDAREGEGGDLGLTLETSLLNERGTARRFPSDAEFALALRTLAAREELVEEAAEEEGAEFDTSFDILALARSDERVAALDGTLEEAAPMVWAMPEVSEETLRIYRTAEQERLMALAEAEAEAEAEA